MVDQVNKGEDEFNLGDGDVDGYQLSEDNQFDQNPVNPGKTGQLGNLIESFKAKRIVLISIGVIIVILALYELVTFFIPEKNNDANIEPVEQVQTPTVSEPQIEQRSTGNMNGARLTEIERQISLRENEINSIIVSLSSIQGSFADLGDQIEGLEKNISALSQQVSSQQATIAQLQKEDEVQDEDRTVYHIQAMIPGRAWLNGSDGSTLTVRSGSEIPGYGTVSTIDINQAIITINTGETIAYDPNDS